MAENTSIKENLFGSSKSKGKQKKRRKDDALESFFEEDEVLLPNAEKNPSHPSNSAPKLQTQSWKR